MSKGYLSVIETLGNVIISKDTEISLLKYEIEKLENKIKSVEQYLDCYKETCECVSK